MSTAYELYRRSTLGVTLTEALDDLVQSGALPPHLAMLVLYQFDKSMSQALAERVRNKISMKVFLLTHPFFCPQRRLTLSSTRVTYGPIASVMKSGPLLRKMSN